MSDSIQIGGNRALLDELRDDLSSHGIGAGILSSTFASQESEAAYGLLKIGAEASVVWMVLSAYLKHRRGKVVLEFDGKKIEAEGKSTEDTLRLLRAGVVRLSTVRKKKDDA